MPDCLESVFKTNYSNYEVLIVDNASSDDTVEYIKSNYPRAQIIINKKNYGFAEGNNIGIKYALRSGTEYAALLNQDTKVDAEWLSELVKVAASNDKVGILSPLQYDYEGRDIDRSNKEHLKLNQNDISSDFIETDSVIGAAMLIKRKLIERVGLFDPIYLSYLEESDLCRRALHCGFKIGITPKSKIYHRSSFLNTENEDERRKIDYLLFRNEFIYCLKDIRRSLLANLLDYGIKHIKDIGHPIKTRGYGKGMLRLATLFCKVPMMLSCIPLIIYKRSVERKLSNEEII